MATNPLTKSQQRKTAATTLPTARVVIAARTRIEFRGLMPNTLIDALTVTRLRHLDGVGCTANGPEWAGTKTFYAHRADMSQFDHLFACSPQDRAGVEQVMAGIQPESRWQGVDELII